MTWIATSSHRLRVESSFQVSGGLWENRKTTCLPRVSLVLAYDEYDIDLALLASNMNIVAIGA